MIRISPLARTSALALVLGLGMTTAPALADMHGKKDGMEKAGMEKAGGKTVVDIAAGNDSFSTLVAAVKAAGLAETLSGDGPFTVFAPTNEAFAKLPAGTVEDLLKPENKDKLREILTYHVVSGKVTASDIKPGEVTTVSGEAAELAMADGKVMIDDATVTKADIMASNGVIHVIDSVILPN